MAGRHHGPFALGRRGENRGDRFRRRAQSLAITPFPDDPDKTYGHGTAVASLIAGNDPSAPGVAPAAELISIRVGDESGKADAFALAAGILAAVDSGAQIINISMG